MKNPAQHLLEFIHHFDIDIVLDVGANQGQFAQQLRLNKYQGTIHSFEPVETSWKILNKVASSDSQWITHPFALGATQEIRPINIAANSAYSSFLNSTEYGEYHFGKILATKTTEKVQVSTLDHFFEQNATELTGRKIFLKMDTQGYGFEVIKGGSQAIRQIIGIQSEVAIKPIYQRPETYREVLESYENQGFHIAGIEPTHRDKNDLSLIEVDCLLVNTRLAIELEKTAQ